MFKCKFEASRERKRPEEPVLLRSLTLPARQRMCQDQSQNSNRQGPLSTAQAPTKSGPSGKSASHQRLGASGSPSMCNRRAGSPGANATSKRCKPSDNPRPRAFMNASLRVQQRKKADGSPFNSSKTRFSPELKKRFANCRASGMGRFSSISTPISRPRVTPNSPHDPE